MILEVCSKLGHTTLYTAPHLLCCRSIALQPYSRAESGSRWWGYRVCDVNVEVWCQGHQLESVQRAILPSRNLLANNISINFQKSLQSCAY